MESSSSRRYLPHPQLYDCPPNSHVFWYGPQENKRGYGGYVFNPSHQRRTTNKSRFVTHVDGNWHLLQQSQQDLFPYLGERRPDIDQFDLTLPDSSREYREAWEASRVPLIDSDEYLDPTSSEESNSEIEENDILLQQICLSEISLDADTVRLSSPRTTFRPQTPIQTMATQTTTMI